jgi:hypothetical protein
MDIDNCSVLMYVNLWLEIFLHTFVKSFFIIDKSLFDIKWFSLISMRDLEKEFISNNRMFFQQYIKLRF